MVSSKKVHCAYCQKKCSGSVLRYQDQYYHKQCFQSLQSELAAARSSNNDGQGPPELYVESATNTTGSESNNRNINSKDPRKRTKEDSGSKTSPPAREQYFHSKSSKTTTTTSTRQKRLYETNEDRENLNQDISRGESSGLPQIPMSSASYFTKGQTLDSRTSPSVRSPTPQGDHNRSATLPHSVSSPSNGFLTESKSTNPMTHSQQLLSATQCAGCKDKIRDGQALIALDLHWHVWCFKCSHCKVALHGEYVAKDGRAYCEKDYQKLFGITCVYCKRYITGKVLQAGEAHHFHPSCARCSKCGDPFVPGEEMYLQGEVTWHPRCGPGPGGLTISPSQINNSSLLMEPNEEPVLDSTRGRSQLQTSRAHSPSLSSRSRSASPFSFMSRQQYDRTSPAYAESEAVGDLSRIYTISYLNADPNQGYLRRPLEPYPPKSPQFSRPTSMTRINGAASDRSRCSSRSQQLYSSSSTRERSMPPPRGMYSVLSSMGRSRASSRARSPSMMNEEAIQLAAYPSGQKPSPDSVPKIERDDFPAPPFPYPNQHRSHRTRGQSAPRVASSTADDQIESKHVADLKGQHEERASRPRSREFAMGSAGANGTREARFSSLSSNDEDDDSIDPQFRKEEQELSKIANGIGKIFLQTLKEREKLRAWKRSNLDPRNASRTPSATREIPSRPLRYDNPMAASPSRDLNRPRPWDSSELPEDVGGDHSPTRTRSSLSRATATTGPPHSAASSTYGYKVVQANRATPKPGYGLSGGPASMINGSNEISFNEQQRVAQAHAADLLGRQQQQNISASTYNRPLASSASAYLRRSMPNVATSRDSTLSHQQHLDGPPKLYPYHLLATTNYRLPPDVDRCHLERHLSNEEFQYIFHCDRIDFYRLPEWKRNELKRRAKLF